MICFGTGHGIRQRVAPGAALARTVCGTVKPHDAFLDSHLCALQVQRALRAVFQTLLGRPLRASALSAPRGRFVGCRRDEIQHDETLICCFAFRSSLLFDVDRCLLILEILTIALTVVASGSSRLPVC